MSRRWMEFLAIVLCLAPAGCTLTGCDAQGVEAPALSGEWQAASSVHAAKESGEDVVVPVLLTFVVTEGGGKVDGQFIQEPMTAEPPPEAERIAAVEGHYDYPSVTLTVILESDTDDPAYQLFKGQMAEHGRTMRLSGPLEAQKNLIFSRQ